MKVKHTFLPLSLYPNTYPFKGKTELEKAQESLNRASKEEIASITEAFKHVPKDSLDAELQIKKIQEKIITSTTLSNDDKERVISLVRGTISTQYGIIAESGTATKIEIAESIEIKKDDSFYSYPICSIGNHFPILTLIIFMHHHHHSHHHHHCHHVIIVVIVIILIIIVIIVIIVITIIIIIIIKVI